MSDQELGALGAEPAEGTPPAQSGDATQQPQTPKPLTADDLAATLSEFESKLERRLQSLNAKQENRIKKEFDTRMQAIEANYAALGMQVPDSVRQKLADDLIQANQGEPQQAAQPAPADANNPVLARAHKIARETCGGLLPTDPEYKLINQDTPDPFDFVESVKAAATAKAARLATERQQRAGPPGSAAPMSVQGAPASGNLMDEYKRQLNQTIQQFGTGSDAVLRLRTEYRRKGLNI